MRKEVDTVSEHFTHNKNNKHTNNTNNNQSDAQILNDGFKSTKDMSTHLLSDSSAAIEKPTEKSDKIEKGIEQQSFIKGAMVLTISIIVVKIIGVLFKVLFTNLVDGVGVGVFNSAYELYNVIFTVASAGFPIALSRMVSEAVSEKRYKDVRKLHKISVPFFVTTGAVCCLLMIALSGAFSKMIGNSAVQLPVIALSPIVFFGCLMSIFRG